MNQSPPTQQRVSGKLVVVSMFALAFVATGILWVYWNMHLMPFMPLQESLVAEFENSSPRVDGGQRKSHRGTPMILRTVMRVPFDPNDPSEKTQELIAERLTRTRELATEHTQIDEYDLLEVHLYHEIQEDVLSQKTFTKELK